MLRINRSTNDYATTLKLEGRLVGLWVEELRSVCEAVSPASSVQLDLDDVRFVDAAGLDLLKQLVANGVRITARSAFVAELLRTADP